jgi:hypothetical protein
MYKKGDSVVLTTSESGDWIGLYINGELVGQDHSFTSTKLLSMLGVSHRNTVVSDDIMAHVAGFPATFEELDEYLDDEMNCNLF